jgi:aspartyl-tRNA(Asn)/glutamyl-tRNA(Gln) amidotransferase subunit C
LWIRDSGGSTKLRGSAKQRSRKIGRFLVKLTETEVRYVAKLANLNLSADEIERMIHDLGDILEHMDRLAGIDTEGVEPMSQVLYETEETATLRPDVERAPLGNDLALANAPASSSGYFKVPRVIER